MIQFINDINKSLVDDYKIEETLSTIEFKHEEDAYIYLYHKDEVISKIDILITLHYDKIFCEIDSKTNPKYRKKGYNTILRIFIILISKIIGIDYIISLAVSPMSKYILKNLHFMYDIDESIIYPNFIPYINTGDDLTKIDKCLFDKIIQDRYHMIPDEDKTEIDQFLDDKIKDEEVPLIAIRRKFSKILTKNKDILLEFNTPYLFDYKHINYNPFDVIDNKSKYSENESEVTSFNHYINVKKYSKFDNLKKILLIYLEKNIDIISDFEQIIEIIHSLFSMFAGYSKKKQKYKSKKKKNLFNNKKSKKIKKKSLFKRKIILQK